jgi:hypothetical protein
VLLATGHGSLLDVIIDAVGLVTFGIGKGLIGSAEATAEIAEDASTVYKAVAGDGTAVTDIIDAGDAAADTGAKASDVRMIPKMLEEMKQVVSVRPVFSAAMKAWEDGKFGASLGDDAFGTLAKAFKSAMGMSSPEIGEALSKTVEAGQEMPYASGTAWTAALFFYPDFTHIPPRAEAQIYLERVGVQQGSRLDRRRHGAELPDRTERIGRVMAETCSQQFCSLAPCGAGGRITAGARMRNCLVQVSDGELTLIQAPATLVAKVPAAAVEIVTPAALRKIGTAVVLRLDGKLLAVEFDGVYRSQQAPANGRKPTLGSVVARAFSLSDITSLRKSLRLARELSSQFTAALVAVGAVDAGQRS